MFRSYRGATVAAGLALVALSVLTAFTVWGWNSYRQYQGQHTEQRQSVSTYKAETNEQYTDNCLKEGFSLSFFKCLAESIDANREAQRSQYDLQAQQEMAEWAFVLFLVSLLGTGVSIFGLVLLFYSLHQTRTAIKDNRYIGQAQTRAYLSSSGGIWRAEVRPDGKVGVWVCIEVVNSGMSPARNVVMFGDISYFGVYDGKAGMLQLTASDFCSDIAANKTTEICRVWFTLAKSKEELETYMTISNGPFSVACNVLWDDVFGQKDGTTFFFIILREIGQTVKLPITGQMVKDTTRAKHTKKDRPDLDKVGHEQEPRPVLDGSKQT